MQRDPETLENSGPLYPIREVSRLTQVNTVTLRAWERRYGLIQPQRTPKGHRLYSVEDIERVHRILEWLDKGVSVSQVGELLDQPQAPVLPPPVDQNWPEYQQRCRHLLQQLDEEGLDQLYSHLFARWSGSQLNQHLWQPLLLLLEEDEISRAFLARFLRTRIGERLAHRHTVATGPKLVLAALSVDDPWPSLLAVHSLLDTDLRVVWFDQPLSGQALLQLAQRVHPRWVFVQGQAAQLTELVTLLPDPQSTQPQWLTLACQVEGLESCTQLCPADIQQRLRLS
ncbi:MerR family transcriptional regulator [Marinospirillum sp.]|uniref:MerR family transcriptional regulator n=1 Tax=Marinospirillum sp. TaxID=2183934 RepID=UPI003A85B54D